MNSKTTRKKKEPTTQIAFKLPSALALQIRLEAAKRGMYPAWVVVERLEDSYKRTPSTN